MGSRALITFSRTFSLKYISLWWRLCEGAMNNSFWVCFVKSCLWCGWKTLENEISTYTHTHNGRAKDFPHFQWTENRIKGRKGAENTHTKTFKLWGYHEPYFRECREEDEEKRSRKGELGLLFIVCLFYILFKNDLGFSSSSFSSSHTTAQLFPKFILSSSQQDHAHRRPPTHHIHSTEHSVWRSALTP